MENLLASRISNRTHKLDKYFDENGLRTVHFEKIIKAY